LIYEGGSDQNIKGTTGRITPNAPLSPKTVIAENEKVGRTGEGTEEAVSRPRYF